MDIILYLKAIVSRLLFIAHGIGSVYVYWQYKVKRGQATEDKYDFFLLTPLFFILVEAALTLGYKKGVELKYFWPSGFLYITCLVPIIWMIEFDLFYRRQQSVNTVSVPSSGGGGSTNSSTSSGSGQVNVLNAKLVSDEGVKKVSELGVVLGVIIGRWLIPRGTLSRDQLSALLLGYVSNSADILELLSTFDEPQLVDQFNVVVGVMVVFTISLYQFPLTTTATMETDDNKNNKTNQIQPVTYSEMLKLQRQGGALKPGGIRTGTRGTPTTDPNRPATQPPLRKVKRPSVRQTVSDDVIHAPIRTRNPRTPTAAIKNREQQVAINEEETTETKPKLFCSRKIHGETFQILVTLLMQDGPFLILRLYLMAEYGVDSELHVFFTCKNAIVSVLLVYRLLVLSCSEEEGEDELALHRIEAENKLRNIQRALDNVELREVNTTDIVVK